MTPAQRAAALRLADVFERMPLGAVDHEAAAMLRELASEPPNCGDFDKLIAEVEADPMMRPHLSAGREWVKTIAAEPQGEPVAWAHKDSDRVIPASTMACARRDGVATLSSVAGYTVPLFSNPPQRKPLTDEQIDALWLKSDDTGDFARAIEKAHGIGEAP